MASPCVLDNQKDLLSDIQNTKKRIRILDQSGAVLNTNCPVLIVNQLMNLDGDELRHYLLWWCKELNFNFMSNDVFKELIPDKQSNWIGLKIEKKIAMFLGAAIQSSRFCYAIFGDLHLEQNAQIFLFNFLKNMTDISQNNVLIAWTYRIQLPNSIPLYFKGFSEDDL